MLLGGTGRGRSTSRHFSPAAKGWDACAGLYIRDRDPALVSNLSFGSRSPTQALRSGSALAALNRSAHALFIHQTPPDLGWCLWLGRENYR